MINEKYNNLKVALRFARGDSMTDHSMVEAFLKYAQRDSQIPLAKKVIDKVWGVYQEHEHQRKQGCLKAALMFARGNSITDNLMVKPFLKYAQRHSSMPLAQSAIDRVWEIYKANNPRRRDEALRIAEDYFKERDSGYQMKFWLNSAKEFSEGIIDRTRISILGLKMRTRLKLKNLVDRITPKANLSLC